MARRRRRRGLAGVLDLDLGSPLKNVGLGAGLNIGGSLIGTRIPVVGGMLAKVPGGPGLGLALAVAAIQYFRGKKSTAIEIGVGGVIVSAPVLIAQSGFLPMGLVTADMGAVVPTVRMSDGSIRALTDGEIGGPEVAVTQGLGMDRVSVYQGGILQ